MEQMYLVFLDLLETSRQQTWSGKRRWWKGWRGRCMGEGECLEQERT
jgi:hypothetical protein